MKRDMSLVRDILLAIEASDSDPDDTIELTLEGRSHEELSYHVMLMHEAGLIVAIDFSSFDGHAWTPQRLTWAGAEFLDSVRDPEVWRRTKAGAAKVGGAGFNLVVELAKGYGKQLVQERLGLAVG